MKLTKTLLTTALFGASIFSFQSTAWADTPEQQFQQGLTAYEQSNYQTAFKLWLPLAEQGDAQAQGGLGMMYERGLGVKQDDFKAVNWYRKAAEQGDADAQLNLGAMYAIGRGVKQDGVEAVKWFRKAAEQGNAKAQNGLGMMYDGGLGIKQDYFKAVKWHRKAAEQGDADAQAILGFLYLLGERGVQVNKSLAKEWFGKACDNGNQNGCEYYGKLNRGEL
ncbi:tetratricopeptide repeat protein [Haemophilus influenzae]|uniref:tetratricopeptide repeat protein n=2 Tax=Haemophilus influenzae TaxID=727 RepID=UPI000E34CBFD|nr:tetratricopeptide repeat protein [Haemophilus influenzae]MCK8791364.1 sel1 repeat family protein [Haemophilus influenzae]MCK9024757.1 sel1 repeat family protein [Haemophilus influenzae]RFO39990.1 sel1 repeat family protein [Haemophilus influenzae]